MKRIKKDLFKIFLVVLLVVPMMVKALPINNTVTSNEIVLLEDSELSKEDYEEKNVRLCTVCILLDIIILICIAALVVRLIKLKSEKRDHDDKE